MRGASPRSNMTSYSGNNNYQNTSGMAGAGSTTGGRGATGIVSPETEVPLPYAENVLALQVCMSGRAVACMLETGYGQGFKLTGDISTKPVGKISL